MAEAVKVAVRVRPFNQREIDRGAKLIINMDGQLTQIQNPATPEQPPKDFAFDYSYWSHDQFFIDEDGVSVGTTPEYASQMKVFEDLGKGVLNNAVEGFNCSLFAYGQTGSGKSYSMVGYGPNRGIVPITCDELFKIIENSTIGTKYQVTFSMLEIYNEQVRDLLTKDNQKGGLTVRQNVKLGAFYVQGLKSVAVGSYKEIEERTKQGTANRTVACTQMNATSSRAHTVVTIQFEQILKNELGKETKKSSVINLVDLAGSERADSTGATGDRLKEGANINKSLSALGNVISALADKASGTSKKIMVPYRDSVLTKLLKNALGGNSKTIMIAALSPADINYDETLGTLRYADRAKKIKNQAVVNENPMEKLIRALKEENENLKKALEGGNLQSYKQMLGERRNSIDLTEEDRVKIKKQVEDDLRAQMTANMTAMKDWDEKLEESRNEIDISDKSKQIESIPHLLNLNEDSMLSGVLYHFFEKQVTSIGRKETNPDIAMSGLSIANEHAIISNINGQITIKAASPGAKTKINGVLIDGEQRLNHHDRILFGSNHMYYFVNPLNLMTSEETPLHEINWEFANKEIAYAKGFLCELSKEHALAREHILELLPRVSEANAISEELDKKMFFEVILKTADDIESGSSAGEGVEVCVKVTNMLNENISIWSRDKFNYRRFMFQDLYQRMQDSDNKLVIEQNDDPFWEPPVDILIGSSIVFLHCLSFVLDIDDVFAITDFKGNQEGEIYVKMVPCNEKGEQLDPDFFVDDCDELIGKPYYFKVIVQKVTIYNPRYKHGLYVSYYEKDALKPTKTTIISDTLCPEYNYINLISIPRVDASHLDWFNNDYLTFHVYGKQIDSVNESFRYMTTKELRHRKENEKYDSIIKKDKLTSESVLMRSDLIFYKKRYEKLQEKEKHIQELVMKWGEKKVKDFDGFYRAMHAAAFHRKGMWKYKINMLKPHLQEMKNKDN